MLALIEAREHLPEDPARPEIGILLEPAANLHEADWGSDNEFAPSGLLVARRQGALAQEIEFIFEITSSFMKHLVRLSAQNP